MRLRISSVFLSLLFAMPIDAAFAAQCNKAATKGIPQLGASTAVSVAAGPVAAGKSFAVDWKRGPMKGRYGVWLMVAFDGPVRFDGKGFYALLPNAEAAFKIGTFGDRTRAVVPYYPEGAANAGTISVIPLQAGTLKVEWAVIGYDGCKAIVAEKGSGATEIRVEATGAPEIVVNEFAGGEPRQRIYAPAGGRVIEVFDGRYRVVDEGSRAEVAERAGETPRFSPTGRYVAAYAEEGMEIIDTVDGKLVYQNTIAEDLAWDNADSFGAIDRGFWGTVEMIEPSLAQPTIIWGQGSCHACDGTGSTALRFDLENNVAVYVGDQGHGASSLTTEAKSVPDKWTPDYETRSAKKELSAFVKKQSQITAFALPKRWELKGGLKFSHVASMKSGNLADDPLTKFVEKPLTEPSAGGIAAVNGSRADYVRIAQWRGLSIVRIQDDDRHILSRLAEFGLPIANEGADGSGVQREVMVVSNETEGVWDEAELAAIGVVIGRIERDAPAAGKVFGETISPCTVDEGKLPNKFQRAFKFASPDRDIWVTHYQCKEGSAAASYPSVGVFDSRAPSVWIPGTELGSREYGGDHGYCYASVADCDFDAQIFGGHLLLLSSRLSRAIEIFDLDTRKNVFKKYDLARGDLLDQVLVSPDGKLVLQINSDGSFSGYRMADATLLFEGRYVDDEVVVWAPDGRFDATSEGAHYVNLRLPGRVGTYTFEQFTAKLRTPGLVDKLLAGETFAPVSLVSPPSLSGAFTADGGRVSGTAAAVGDISVASLLVFQDGLLTDKLDKSGAAFNLDVGLLPGARWVSLVAVDESGLASLPMGRDLPPRPDAPRKVHLLAVGVDDYDDPSIPDLGLAVSDARRFAEAVGAIGSDVVVSSSRVLDERAATRDGVLAALRQTLDGARPGETVLLFFAGHGVRDANGTYFLATPDTRIDDIAGSALPWDAVAELLREKPTRIAVFLDTCHSGAAGTEAAFSTNDGAAASLLERIPSGIVVFSASKGRELSEEAASVGGGVFTSALVDVIARDRARFDANRNGAIEISELYRGVKGAVVADTEGRQTPWIARNQMVGDFALF